jgi:hypothetical protein
MVIGAALFGIGAMLAAYAIVRRLAKADDGAVI